MDGTASGALIGYGLIGMGALTVRSCPYSHSKIPCACLYAVGDGDRKWRGKIGIADMEITRV